MPKAYVIISETIHDPAGMAAYSQAAAGAMQGVAVRPLVIDKQVEVLEGEWPAQQTVVLEFESPEAARDWYHSDSYQAAAALRWAAADTNMIIAVGFEPPGT